MSYSNAAIASWKDGQYPSDDSGVLVKHDQSNYLYDLEAITPEFKDWVAYTFAGDNDPELTQDTDIDQYLATIGAVISVYNA